MKRLTRPPTTLTAFIAAAVCAAGTAAVAADVIEPIPQRFSAAGVNEVPEFRRHVVPLLGKLGCNGRACHGSFQGQGGFQLSLFGYDFKMDHENLTQGTDDKEPRADVEFPEASLMLEKPTLVVPHKGGRRMDIGSWQHRVLLQWIKGGAKGVPNDHPEFQGLDITPREIVFNGQGESAQLKVIARWSDGTKEDVTTLCRFHTNDGQVAEITEVGLVTAVEPGDTHVVVSYDTGVVPIPVIRPVSDLVGAKYPNVPTPTKIDELVVQKLRKLGIVPSEETTDAEFLRRVSLDITGTLPAPREVAAFLSDPSPDKRSRKIDELLESPAYAAWWTTRLCDFTGNNERQLNNISPIRGAAAQEWYDWIYKRVADNTPYDKLVEGIVVATSRNRGESFTEYSKAMSELYSRGSKASFAERDFMPHYWARRMLRQPDERAIAFAYTFMGIRIQCAQCHKHPFDQWTQDDFKQFTGFFANTTFGTNPESRKEYNEILKELGVEGRGNQVRRELAGLLREGKVVPFQEVYATRPRGRGNAGPRNRRRGAGRGATEAKLLGNEAVDLTKHDDARQPLMEWLRRKDNPYFARAFVNRVWADYFGRGIVDPPDDLSLANPPGNKPLLDYLAQGFIDSGFDMKWLHREITSSRTYQLSWKPNETNRLDEKNFSRAVPRRLPAEVAVDALQHATASDEAIAKMHREVDGRAIALAGVGARGGGRRGVTTYALTVFGRSIRESNCDCDRSSEPSLLQTVYLQNDQEVFSMIDRRDGWLNQLASELGLRQSPNAQEPDARTPARVGMQRAQLQRSVATLQKRVQQLRKQGNDEQATRVQRRLNVLRKQLAAARGPARTPARKAETTTAARRTPDEAAAPDLTSVIRQAYLRTLNRYPTEDELSRARGFIQSSDGVLEGVRGLLWALINTKEFIVNH